MSDQMCLNSLQTKKKKKTSLSDHPILLLKWSPVGWDTFRIKNLHKATLSTLNKQDQNICHDTANKKYYQREWKMYFLYRILNLLKITYSGRLDYGEAKIPDPSCNRKKYKESLRHYVTVQTICTFVLQSG